MGDFVGGNAIFKCARCAVVTLSCLPCNVSHTFEGILSREYLLTGKFRRCSVEKGLLIARSATSPTRGKRYCWCVPGHFTDATNVPREVGSWPLHRLTIAKSGPPDLVVCCITRYMSTTLAILRTWQPPVLALLTLTHEDLVHSFSRCRRQENKPTTVWSGFVQTKDPLQLNEACTLWLSPPRLMCRSALGENIARKRIKTPHRYETAMVKLRG